MSAIDLAVWHGFMTRWSPEDYARLDALTSDERHYPACAYTDAVIGRLRASRDAEFDGLLCESVRWFASPDFDWLEDAEEIERYSVHLSLSAPAIPVRCLVQSGEEPAGSWHQINNGATRRWSAVHGEMAWR